MHRCAGAGVSVTQQIDLRGSAGRLIASVMFGIAEIEREHIRERQAAGIAVAKEKGIYTGRKPGTHKAKPERAWDMRDQDMTKPEIARALGVSSQTVWRYLKQRPKQLKTMKVELYLTVENNSKLGFQEQPTDFLRLAGYHNKCSRR